MNPQVLARDLRIAQAIRRLNRDLGRRLWVLRAVSQTAFLVGSLDCVRHIVLDAFPGGSWELYARYVYSMRMLALSVETLLPWLAIALIWARAHSMVQTRRAELVAQTLQR